MVRRSWIPILLSCSIADAALPGPASAGDVIATAGVLLSIQPEAYPESRGPYLNHALGGNAGGLVVALQRQRSRSLTLGLELSTTTFFRTQQQGRFISGPGCDHPGWPEGCFAVSSRGRDTILSALGGFGPGPVELKLGVAVVLAQTRQGGASYDYSGAASDHGRTRRASVQERSHCAFAHIPIQQGD